MKVVMQAALHGRAKYATFMVMLPKIGKWLFW